RAGQGREDADEGQDPAHRRRDRGVLMTVDLSELVPFAVAPCTLIALLGAGLRWTRTGIAAVASTAQRTHRELLTSDDRTIADHVQESARAIDRINRHIEELTRSAQENRDRSIRAEALAESAHTRLDNHLINDHGFHVAPNETKEN